MNLKPERLFLALVFFGAIATLLVAASDGIAADTMFQMPLFVTGMVHGVAFFVTMALFLLAEYRKQNRND